MNKPDHVTYLLGAGFSAPLGFPVMSNFLIKSKDMFAGDPEKYKHFKEVFDTIKTIAIAKNYYTTDLFNIEEILSMLEIHEFIEGNKLSESFTNYIRDVILFYTPSSMLPYKHIATIMNWQDRIFSGKLEWKDYGYFVMNLFGLKPEKAGTTSFTGVNFLRNPSPVATYSVITLNYDRVLENVCDYLNKGRHDDGDIQFNTNGTDASYPTLAKLHGSVDSKAIVPPTWSKGTHPEIVSIWQRAMHELENANHLRIIGYSLPLADSYVRYLLKTATLNAPNFKQIDVICLDPDGAVKSRYIDFVTHPNFRFVSARTEEYLEELSDISLRVYTGNWYNKLEEAHESFFWKHQQ